MERIGQLLTFGKEFLADKTFENLNDCILGDLKDTIEKTILELRCENEMFWDHFLIPQSLKVRYLTLHKECKACVARLTASGGRGMAKARQTHLFSISDDEDDSFENPRTCFDHLKTLFLDLEIECNHYLKTSTEDVGSEGPLAAQEEQVKLPLVLFTDFSECFSKLNRIFRFQAQSQPVRGSKVSSTDLEEAKALILECQKEKMLVHVWNLLRDSNKIAKILRRMLQGCRVLYGDKLMTGPEPSKRRKESTSERMSPMPTKQISSIKLSVNLSKIRPKYSGRFNESFVNEVHELFCQDDMSMHSRGGDLRLRTARVRAPDPPVREYQMPRPPPPRRLPGDDAFGRCYCSIF